MRIAPDPSGAPIGTLAAAVLAVLVACGGSEQPDPAADSAGESIAGARSGADTAEPPRIPDAELGELARENVGLSVPWTRGRINRDGPDDPPSTTTLRAISFSTLENVDRMVLEFDSAGGYPGFLVESSINPLPRCESGDSVAVEGQGLLRVRIRHAAADESVLGDALQRPELDNVTAVHRSCAVQDTVEWVLDVQRATYYRIVEASNPPRLVVDVMQSLEPAAGEGEAGEGE